MKPVLNEATGEATDERLKDQKIVSLQIGLLQSGKLVYTTSANSKPVSSERIPGCNKHSFIASGSDKKS